VNVAATAAVRPYARASRQEARWVIAQHVASSAMRWAVVWGAIFGLVVVSTIESIVKAYPSVSGRLQLAQTSQSFAFIAGTGHHLETVAGYTVWKVLTTTAFIGAIWGLRTSIGLLRGEEDAGRWELLLAGQTTRRRATAEALVGLGVALAAMFIVTAVVTVLAGRLPGARFTIDGSLLFAAAMVSGAAIFLGVGAVASQLAATSGQAAMLTTAFLGVSYVIRVLADSSTSRGWLRWATPMGWIENVQPLADPQPLALVPIFGLVLVCVATTVVLAGRRDLNASVLHESEGRLRKVIWLRGPIGLALRLNRGAAVGWLIGVGGTCALLGSVAHAYATLLNSSPAIEAALGRLGVRRVAEGYLGIEFFMVEMIVTLMAASQIVSIRDEEATGRLDNLLVLPVPRLAWLAGRLAVSLTLILLAGLTAGLSSWLGSATQHTGVSLPTLLEAGLNACVAPVLVLGVGGLVLGVLPRLTAAVVYGLIAWSLVIDLLAAFIRGNDWLRDSSVFTHIALAPAARVDWGTNTIVVLIGLAAVVVGAIAFQRRDIAYA
jgi:polyether ionophore transport system permease protein